jgi:hypothetical protein
MTLGNLIRVTNFYGIEQSIYWLFNDELQKYKLNRDWINENKEKIELILNGLTVRKDKKKLLIIDLKFFFVHLLTLHFFGITSFLLLEFLVILYILKNWGI